MRVRDLSPGEFGQRGLQLARSHIRPDDPSQLYRGIGRETNFVLKGLGFIHLVNAVAFDVEFPSVIDTTQAGIFITPQPQ